MTKHANGDEFIHWTPAATRAAQAELAEYFGRDQMQWSDDQVWQAVRSAVTHAVDRLSRWPGETSAAAMQHLAEIYGAANPPLEFALADCTLAYETLGAPVVDAWVKFAGLTFAFQAICYVATHSRYKAYESYLRNLHPHLRVASPACKMAVAELAANVRNNAPLGLRNLCACLTTRLDWAYQDFADAEQSSSHGQLLNAAWLLPGFDVPQALKCIATRDGINLQSYPIYGALHVHGVAAVALAAAAATHWATQCGHITNPDNRRRLTSLIAPLQLVHNSVGVVAIACAVASHPDWKGVPPSRDARRPVYALLRNAPVAAVDEIARAYADQAWAIKLLPKLEKLAGRPITREFWHYSKLPPVAPAAIVEALITAWQNGNVDDASTQQIGSAQLQAIAEALAKGWLAVDLQDKDVWVMDPIFHHASEATVLTLHKALNDKTRAPTVRVEKLKVAYLAALARCDHEDAAMLFVEQSNHSQLVARSKELGRTSAELIITSIPDFGFDADCTIGLDTDDVSFRCGFDLQWRPFVVTAAGEQLEALPATAPLVMREAWSRLQAKVKTFAQVQRGRLYDEARFGVAPAVPVHLFASFCIDNPLMRRIVETALWRISHAAGHQELARITRQGTFVDAYERALDVATDATISICQRDLTDAERVAWFNAFDRCAIDSICQFKSERHYTHTTRPIKLEQVAKPTTTSLDWVAGRIVPKEKLSQLDDAWTRSGDTFEITSGKPGVFARMNVQDHDLDRCILGPVLLSKRYSLMPVRMMERASRSLRALAEHPYLWPAAGEPASNEQVQQ